MAITPPSRRAGGFRHAARLVEDPVKRAGASRGFAVARLLTQWEAIVGPEAARLTRPVKLGWGRGKRAAGLGATLTLAVPAAAAPMVQMLLPQIRERVNAAMGHAAVARIVLSAGASAAAPVFATARGFAAAPGLAEGQAGFDGPPPRPNPTRPDPTRPDPTRPNPTRPDPTRPDPTLTAGVQDPALRAALEALARNVLSRSEARKGPHP